MNNRPHIVLATIGTDGDVYPFLGLGAELRARGYEVTLAASERYARRAAQAGLGYRELFSNAEFEGLLHREEFWHPVKGALLLARWGAPRLGRQYEVLSALTASRPSLLVANPGVLAARILQEKLGVPLISVVLQPWAIPSVQVPPVMMGGLSLPGWLPRPLVRAHFRLLDGFASQLIGRQLNSFRASLGLPPVRRLFQWWMSPDLMLGLFPDWFGDPQPDWPAQLRLTDFVLNDGQSNGVLPEETASFCRAGQPPIGFTFGTGMAHATELFACAAEACRRLGVRAVFLSRFHGEAMRGLPPYVHHCNFAPFQQLFPQCAAIVHHGGIGTTAQALAAGVPQLILPFAFDQQDNAMRVKRLQAGDWLKPGQRNPTVLAATLKKLLEPSGAQAARTLAARLEGRSGMARAADEIAAMHSRVE